MNSLRRFFAIVRKEFRQLVRDRLTFGMIVGIPIIQLTIFGYAINTDVRHLRAAVSDDSRTDLSRELIAMVRETQVVDIIGHASGPRQLEQWIKEGRISVGIVIPYDYARRLERGEDRPAQLLVDGSDPIVGQAAVQVAGLRIPGTKALATSRATDTDERFHAAAVAATAATQQFPINPVTAFEIRLDYNPERISAVSIVPGLLGVILTMTMVLMTAVAIVRERERGTLEMLITTPVKTVELMVGKIVPYIGVGLVQMSLILFLGHLMFGVPVRGSLLHLYLAGLAFITANLTMGLLNSTFAQNQFQAMQMTFFFFLPSILLSGFMFPFDGMPVPAQWIGELLPLTHFNRMSRGILLRGATLSEIGRDLWPLAAFFCVMMTVVLLRFRKRLD
ncbi:MAG: ABC transporter permease [Verrucomicrobia bacterium]|nr:ABC transporter permease [Verrucomicrobiota bacterium]